MIWTNEETLTSVNDLMMRFVNYKLYKKWSFDLNIFVSALW